jgi:hypothetical protein
VPDQVRESSSDREKQEAWFAAIWAWSSQFHLPYRLFLANKGKLLRFVPLAQQL